MTDKNQTETPLPDEKLEEQSEEQSVEIIDSQEQSETDETEEPSDFLLKWQQRHQEYLAEQSDSSEEEKINEESSESISDDRETPPFSLFKRDLKKATSGDDEDENSQEQLSEIAHKTKPHIPRIALWRSAPIYLVSVAFVILSLYFLSPLSKQKNIQVTGNQQVTSEAIIKDSLISSKDYALSTWLNKDGHAVHIKASSPWIKSVNIGYQFPNRFTIAVTEYTAVGYVKEGEQYHQVLSSGDVLSTPVATTALPESFMTINLSDKALIKKLVLQFGKVNQSIVSEIQTVDLTPSKVTNDLLTLTMTNGNKVLVPLSEIDIKLPYYEKIAPQLTEASTIDMEVGIYSYTNAS